MAQYRWTEKLQGHEGLTQYRDSQGTIWCISPSRRKAVPLLGSATAFGPYDWDAARACGQEVDAALPEKDRRVTHAGSAWREVYDYLRS